jgi:pyruvate/2-oxoglutarate dehydrogenase complex dihydrolipoamide dehydrogenase (E3) component
MEASVSHSPNLHPLDEHNELLLSQVHPENWQNPEPADCYDLVVIGAGTAGLVVAAGAAGLDLGLKVALIERHLMGGDCLNVGCVPSKCLIRSSRVVADIRGAKSFGIEPPASIEVDFGTVMARLRRLRASISHHDSALRFQQLGVDVFLGNGAFVREGIIQVRDHSDLNGEGKAVDCELRYKKAVIATGARAARPEIAGLDRVGYLTNETVFNLTECSKRLGVIGGGPIGCELAQAFQRLGSQVTLFHRGDHLLNKEDPDAAAILQQVFLQEGIHLVLGCTLHQIEQTPEGKRIRFNSGGKEETVTVDEILVGTGRSPNVEGLNLESVGVAYNPHQGIQVNDYLQTSNPKIFAAGDICMNWKFTHAADAAARIVIKNALFSPFGLGRAKLKDLVMPWATYTDPEIAQVGLSEQAAKQQGLAIETIHIPFNKVDRAFMDGEENGFIKIHYLQGSDRIVGATIVARHAGDMISEVTTAIVHKIGLGKLAAVIHPYPTQAEAIKKAADAYRRQLLTPRTKRLLKLLLQLP